MAANNTTKGPIATTGAAVSVVPVINALLRQRRHHRRHRISSLSIMFFFSILLSAVYISLIIFHNSNNGNISTTKMVGDELLHESFRALNKERRTTTTTSSKQQKQQQQQQKGQNMNNENIKITNKIKNDLKNNNNNDERQSNQQQQQQPTQYATFPPKQQLSSNKHYTTNHPKPKPLLAFLEPSINYYKTPPNIKKTNNDQSTTTSATTNDDMGELITPLPLRTHNHPSHLTIQSYPHVSSCSDIPHNLPVDPGFAPSPNNNTKSKHRFLMTNQNNHVPIYPNRLSSYLPYCPIDSDPYLPWIHDVFSSSDGTFVKIIAQNRRRCHTGRLFQNDVRNLNPQVSLFQPVGIKRIDVVDFEEGAEGHEPKRRRRQQRYRLARYDEADDDAKNTRFVCRFHSGYDYDSATNDDDDDVSSASSSSSPASIYGETLSTYPFNFEERHYYKPHGFPMITPDGKQDRSYFWLSTLQFHCPIPSELGSFVVDGTVEGLLYLDIVPIRTNPRGLDRYLPEEEEIKLGSKGGKRLKVDEVWGRDHVLPKVEASGRWGNIPVCRPPQPTTTTTGGLETDDDDDDGNKTKRQQQQQQQRDESAITIGDTGGDSHHSSSHHNATTTTNDKAHYLVGCLWASARYVTRLNDVRRDTRHRIIEWIEFHLMVGFDHIYIYDNSLANHIPPEEAEDNDKKQPTTTTKRSHNSTTTTNQNDDDSNLSYLTSLFGRDKITIITWPFRVCNNNYPGNKDNPGERSSQYAAENSCRSRYGPYTTWLASFDVDEYLIPMGGRESLREVLMEKEREGVEVLSFRSTNGFLRREGSIPYRDDKKCSTSPDSSSPSSNNPQDHHDNNCLSKSPNVTFLSAYNCDKLRTPTTYHKPKGPGVYKRAKKEIYRPSFVKAHFVHYSVVTEDNMWSHNRTRSRTGDQERFTNETTEALMMHARTIDGDETFDWWKICRRKSDFRSCKVAVPFPSSSSSSAETGGVTTDDDGLLYNCMINEKVDDYWVPRLVEAMETRRRMWAAAASAADDDDNGGRG